MALKSDRVNYGDDISYFWTGAVAERGGIATITTAGSGAAMDQSAAVAGYAADPSGKTPIGVLMNDVVNLDLTRQHKNFHRDEVQLNGKVTLWQDCKVVTNMFAPAQTPGAGARLFVTVSGLLTATDFGAAASPVVGVALSTRDEEGYAKVQIKLPQSARS